MTESIRDPLFAALFDRTTEQREQHTRRLLTIIEQQPEMPIDQASRLADTQMNVGFFAELDDIARGRVSDSGFDVNRKSGSEEYDQAVESQLIKLRKEIGDLHAAMPLPMIEGYNK